MQTPIVFGTSGHRGIIGEEFTVDHVIAIAHAVSDFLLEDFQFPRIAIGYDPRKGNDPNRRKGSFTAALVTTLLHRGVSVDFYTIPVPTPLISLHIIENELQGGLILTASHNPANYNGIKFNPSNGAPAPVSVTQRIQDLANGYFKNPPDTKGEKPGELDLFDTVDEFVEELIEVVQFICLENNFTGIGFNPVIDCKHGTAGPVWDKLFSDMNVKGHTLLHEKPLQSFGGIETNPTKTDHLQELRLIMKLKKSKIGIANDPDADRHVILDEFGAVVSPEIISVIILDFLSANGPALSGIITTVASSSIVRKATTLLGIPYEETPVGFKHFASFFEDSFARSEVGIGVESSGGLSISIHTYEKCGFLPGVFIMYIMAKTDKSLSELVAQVQAKYGTYFFKELELEFHPSDKTVIRSHLEAFDIRKSPNYFDIPFASASHMDGLKLNFSDHSWVLFRFSGTEPLIRVYAESNDPDKTADLIKNSALYIKSLFSQL